jgi:hypothetical protein
MTTQVARHHKKYRMDVFECKRWWWRRMFKFTVAFVWTLISWVTILAKIRGSSVEATMYYFTNWTFVLTAAYFTSEVIMFRFRTYSRFVAPTCTADGNDSLNVILFWWVLGQNISVFSLDFVLMLQNDGLVIEETKAGGGRFTVGQVMNFDKLFHVLPTVVMLLYYILSSDDIRKSMENVFYGQKRNAIGLLTCCLHVFSGLKILIFFELYFGFNAVYQVHMPWVYGMSLSAMLLFCLVGPLYYLILPKNMIMSEENIV